MIELEREFRWLRRSLLLLILVAAGSWISNLTFSQKQEKVLESISNRVTSIQFDGRELETRMDSLEGAIRGR